MQTLQWCLSASFLKAGCKLVSFPDLVHVKAIAVFITRVQYLAETLLRKNAVGKPSNISFTFPESWDVPGWWSRIRLW